MLTDRHREVVDCDALMQNGLVLLGPVSGWLVTVQSHLPTRDAVLKQPPSIS